MTGVSVENAPPKAQAKAPEENGARHVLRRMRQIAKVHGWKGLFLFLARRILWWVPGGECTRNFLYVLATPRPAPKAVEAAKAHVFKFATREDLMALRALLPTHIRDDIVAAFERGHKCLLQHDGGKLAGYTWVAPSPLTEIVWGFHVNLADDVVYNYKGYTAPEYRGAGFQALRHLKVLEMTGAKALFGYVDHVNLDSQKGVEKSGYRKVGVLTGVRRGGKIRFRLRMDDTRWSTASRT
jgi:hypothetical protein